ncbi:MAG TPA: molybdopterin-binding protein [Xanthobacteraceae bacterium]|jgi:molybdopterin biosynthesis enzyme|nr:molybdopterin-binding protein [Xanthobacteraceae bacterium]
MAQDFTHQPSSHRASDQDFQRISRLMPLRAVLSLIATRVGAVKARKCETAAAAGLTLAEDLVTAERPTISIALADGFAVEAAAVADAGPYAPALLASLPQWVDAGQAMPPGTDAVAPLDAITQRGERVEAVAPVMPGQGVLPAGGDAAAQTVLRRGGERLRDLDCAVAASVGFAALNVREPSIWIARGRSTTTPLIDAGLAMLARLVGQAGAVVRGELADLHEALARDEADAVIAFGGTGGGRDDDSVRTLARLGRVETHGIAVSPGETAAFGFAGERPVLLIPGRIDAALAIWMLIGRHLVAKLAAGRAADTATTLMPLARKVTSTIGMTELVPVRCVGGVAEPLGTGYLSLTALTHSDGWIVVPAGSEGFQQGTDVAVKPWS